MLSQQRGGVCDDGGEDQHDEPLTSGKAGVEQVPLQYGVAPGHDGNDHRWIFRALALVDSHRVGGAMEVVPPGKTYIIVLCRAGRKPLRPGLSAPALQLRDA